MTVFRLCIDGGYIEDLTLPENSFQLGEQVVRPHGTYYVYSVDCGRDEGVDYIVNLTEHNHHASPYPKIILTQRKL